ncbi:coiled-coil domain-containing protein 88B-like [Ambystoma mexicanum]|uniref:coiled-coil domain-containing protein 88B-like n=1 Tax=Ambystoma mexicanum TaxID=8296 RepID=UPI0037E6FDE3
MCPSLPGDLVSMTVLRQQRLGRECRGPQGGVPRKRSVSRMSSVCLSVSSADDAQWRLPRYRNIHLYQWMDPEGRIIRVSSSAASPPPYASHHEFYPESKASFPPFPLEDALEAELMRSEGRRSAMTDSLYTAYSAMRHQDECLQEQDRGLVSSRAQMDHLFFKQEFIASKICHLKNGRSLKSSLMLSSIDPRHEQAQRLSRLEEEMKNIRSKIRAGTFEQRSSSPPVAVEPPGVRSGPSEGIWEELQEYAERRHQAEREKDYLQLQMSSANSQLFHAKLSANQLAKEKLALECELSASRTISENLLLEVASLRQNMQSLEESVIGGKSSEAKFDERIRNLTQENKHLLSQKELLLETIKRQTWGADSLDVVVKPEGLCKKPTGPPLVFSSDGFHPCLLTPSSNEAEVPVMEHSVKPNNKETFPSEQVLNDASKRLCKKPTGPPLVFSSEGFHPCVLTSSGNETEVPALEHSVRPNHEETLPSDREVNDAPKRSEDTGCREKYRTPRQKMSRLLRKLDGVLSSNWQAKHEKEQILDSLMSLLKDAVDTETSSGQRRKEVETLLREHLNLKQNFHDRENQILAVVIELQNIRKAYEGALRHSTHPDDQSAKDWVARVSLIKKCLETLQNYHEKKEVLEKEHSLLKGRRSPSDVKPQVHRKSSPERAPSSTY